MWKKGTGLQQNCCKVSDYQLGPALKKNPYIYIIEAESDWGLKTCNTKQTLYTIDRQHLIILCVCIVWKGGNSPCVSRCYFSVAAPRSGLAAKHFIDVGGELCNSIILLILYMHYFSVETDGCAGLLACFSRCEIHSKESSGTETSPRQTQWLQDICCSFVHLWWC